MEDDEEPLPEQLENYIAILKDNSKYDKLPSKEIDYGGLKYKNQIINLSMQTRIKKCDKFSNELIFSDYKYKFSFENEEQRDKSFELINVFISFKDGKHRKFDCHCYNILSEEIRLEFLESNLLDLDKELNDNE